MVWARDDERDRDQLRDAGQLPAVPGHLSLRRQVPDTEDCGRCHIRLLCCGDDHQDGG